MHVGFGGSMCISLFVCSFYCESEIRTRSRSVPHSFFAPPDSTQSLDRSPGVIGEELLLPSHQDGEQPGAAVR